jgi:hypothetical protein
MWSLWKRCGGLGDELVAIVIKSNNGSGVQAICKVCDDEQGI